MKKIKLNAEMVLNFMIILLASIGIYTCGWINGCLYTEDVVATAEKEIEYVYITIPEEEKKEESEIDIPVDDSLVDIEDVTEENVEDDVEEPPVLIEVVEPLEWPKLYTEEDAIVLAKTVYGEARGIGELVLSNGAVISGDAQRAAVMWNILNRLDAGYADSILEICDAPNQYVGYIESNPVDEDLLELAYDVLERWNSEKHGEESVGRVLPSDYLWFRGDGKHNWFRNEYRSSETWDWSWGDPYANR